MNEITPFDFDGAQVRVIMRDGEPWFMATDVATALGYANGPDALARLVDSDDRLTIGNPDGGGQRNIINESGLYALIFGSRLDAAKRFKRWVTAEVLPALRRTGTYAVAPAEQPADDLAVVEHIVAAIRADRARLEAVEQRLAITEARVSAAAGEHDEFTTLAYAKLNDLPTDRISCQRHGQRASRLMRERGTEPRKRQDATFGAVNVYPVDVLDETAEAA